MRRFTIFLLASCAGTAEVQKPAEPEPVATVSEVPAVDPWAVEWPSSMSAPTPPPAEPAPAPYALPTVLEMPKTDEQLTAASPRSVRTGMHSFAIEQVAATEDGKHVVTVDGRGSARFWPTLDGTREPVIIELRARRSLAITRVNGDIAIAGLDEIGQLELLRLRSTGELVQRAQIATRRPLVLLRATANGFVGVLEDRAVVVLDAAGKSRGELVAPVGQHVANVAVSRERALALIESDGKLRGRWIELGTVGWGDSTAELPIEAKHVALSPDHMRIAGVQTGGKRLVIVKLATGAVMAKPVKDDFEDPSLRPLGFTSKNDLAIARSDEVLWWRNGRLEHANIFALSIAVAGDQLISSGSSLWLQISKADSASQFVGYKLGGPTSLHATTTGFLISDGASLVELDRTLAATAIHEMPKPDGRYALSPLQGLDATHVLARGYVQGKSGAYVLDLETKQATLVLTPANVYDYHPASRLAISHGSSGMQIMQWDPKRKQFGDATDVPDTARDKNSMHHQVVLLDPAIAGGNAVARVSTMQNPGGTAIDAEWALFRVEQEQDGDALQIEETKRGKRKLPFEWFDVHPNTDMLPVPIRAHAQRSPDKKLVAELVGARIVLRDSKRKELWTVPSHGAHSLAWSPSGELYAYGAGIARLDLATGALRECRCGWRFGRWDQAPQGWGGAALCEAAEHS